MEGGKAENLSQSGLFGRFVVSEFNILMVNGPFLVFWGLILFLHLVYSPLPFQLDYVSVNVVFVPQAVGLYFFLLLLVDEVIYEACATFLIGGTGGG